MMKRALINHLACPACHGQFSLIAQQLTSQQGITEGTLTCRWCAAVYPIRTGIPRFLVADRQGSAGLLARTQRTYSFTWRRFGLQEIKQGWEKDSYRYSELIPRSLISGERKLGLDAGCGSGADLLRMATGNAKLIGIDLSEGVEAAAEATQHLPNVQIVQADIYHLPFQPEIFDFIYSFGVLHHLPDPALGFERLARLLKPGAPLITYLYEDFSDRSVGERMLLHLIRLVRTVTSRLPTSWLYACCWVVVPAVWLCCAVPARLLRRRFPQLADHIPFRHTLRWPVLASDLFDRFAPPVEWRFSREGVANLYRRAGLEQVEIRRYRGWVSWGFKSQPPTATEEASATSQDAVGALSGGQR